MNTSPPTGRPVGTPTKAFAALIGLSALFVLVQYFTSGEFVTDGMPAAARDTWTAIHGFGAYPVMLTALAAAVIAARRLRPIRGLTIGSAAYFVATVAQWLLGHAITTLGIDALTPVHVVNAAIVLGLAVWLSTRAALHLRSSSREGAAAA